MHICCATLLLLWLLPGVSLANEPVPSSAQLASRYVGGFTLVGAGNVAFDVILRADGSSHSTWVEGPSGARGEQGSWKPYGNGVLVEYGSGWRDWLRVSDSGAASAGLIQQATWKKDQSLLEHPYAVARALPLDGPRAQFVGVFAIALVESEPGLDITLQSSGRAFSNAQGADSLVPGVWWVEKDRARMIWADGWRNEFTRARAGWSHKTWKPGNEFSAKPWKSGVLEAVATLAPR